jgi:transposase
MGRVLRSPPGRLWIQSVLHPLPPVGQALASVDAPEPQGWGEGLCRLCRPDRADRRPAHRRGSPSPDPHRRPRCQQLAIISPYAEAYASQELANWIGAHVRMFSFLGGMSEIVVPDNLKAGVKHPCRYEPDLNPTYQDLAEHYGIAVIPTRVRKPKDKAKAEVGVQVVERWILARLRNHTFFSLAALNQAIRELLSELNLRPMEHLGRSRRELFEELDQPALKPLPELAYEFAIWKKARVSIGPDTATTSSSRSTTTVSPKTLIHKEVYVRATESTIEIFFDHQRVASHLRVASRGRHTTISEHMPPAYQHYQEWSPQRLTHWTQSIGPHTAQLVQMLVDSRKHQAIRSPASLPLMPGPPAPRQPLRRGTPGGCLSPRSSGRYLFLQRRQEHPGCQARPD